jgi:type VI secretion system Hcp family effector
MTFKVLKYALGLLLVCQLAPQCFAQQNTIFVKFDGFNCQGAMNPDFPGFSAVSSVALGGSNTVATSSGGAGSLTGRASFDDTKVVKTLDDCTPLLYQNLAKGTFLKTVTIEIMTPATSTTPATRLLEIVMTDVIVTSDEFAEAVGGRPSEVVTLYWVKITITHVPSNTTFTWDKSTNASF